MTQTVHETPEDFAARALELLEQSYAYYSPDPEEATEAVQATEETYFEYVKAA
jgi:hypothetical protein